jgi:hypothetical protein
MVKAPRIKLSNGHLSTIPDYYLQLDNGLIVPKSYWEATEEVRSIVCNGCGSAGWKGILIPDNLYGVPIGKECCWPHDWDYSEGDTWLCKFWADEIFRHNLLLLSEKRSLTSVMRCLRCRAAEGYFESVEHFGNTNFWAGKVKPPM